jgi:hypothetical protein
MSVMEQQPARPKHVAPVHAFTTMLCFCLHTCSLACPPTVTLTLIPNFPRVWRCSCGDGECNYRRGDGA